MDAGPSLVPRIEECSDEFEHTLSNTHPAARRIYLFCLSAFGASLSSPPSGARSAQTLSLAQGAKGARRIITGQPISRHYASSDIF